MNKVYRMRNTGGNSAKYGLCEVCNRQVDSVFILTEGRTYAKHDGLMGVTHHNCLQSFGHKDCLAGLTVKA